MSGIFRHSAPTSNTNNASETTPHKRLSFGAFCTSPGTLQDVTMDNAYGVGYRSPCVSMQQYHGATSPAVQGRSVREFEEHTAQLRKENFNLKLRLYFIEENMPALKSNGGDGCDTVMRELIDHKVEVEMLRRELEEKKGVLKDALQAIEDLENIQKETETNYEAKMDDMKQKIQLFEMERNAEKSENNELLNTMLGRSDIVTEHVNTLQKIRELEAQVKTDEETISELQNKVDFFDSIIEKREKTIQEFEEKTKKLEYQNAELQEELDNYKRKMTSSEHCKRKDKNCGCKDVDDYLQNVCYKNNLENCVQGARNQSETIKNLQHVQAEIQQYRIEMADKTCYIDELEEQNAELRKKIEEATRSIQLLKQAAKTQQIELRKLRSDKENTQNEALSLDSINMALNNKKSTSASSNVEDKSFIHSLSDTDAHKTADDSLKITVERQEKLIKCLQSENKKKTADLQKLVNKELWEKNREIERLTKLLNAQNPNTSVAASVASEVSGELQQSFTERDYADAIERNKQLQRKVDKLIQRLGDEHENESLITKLRAEVRSARADAECAEQFRLDCAKMCSTLTERLEELAGFLYSLLKNKDILGLLAADRKRAMRKAVDRSLDLSKSLNRTLSITGVSMSEYSVSQLCNLSEILNDDSFDLMGIIDDSVNLNESKLIAIENLKAENKALKRELDKRRNVDLKKERRSLPAAASVALENQSESEAWSEPDRKVSMARMGLEDHSTSLNLSKDLNTKHIDTDSESETDAADTTNQLNHSRNAKLRAQQQEIITQLERLVAQRDERILQVQCQLVDVDNRLKKESLRVLELTREMRYLRERNEQLQTDLLAIGSDAQNSNHEQSSNESMWLRQIEEQSELLARIEKERDRLDDEARAATQQVKSLKATLEKERLQHAEKLQKANEEQQIEVQKMQKTMDALLQQQLEEQQEQQKETIQQLSQLQHQYVEAQRNIDSHIENSKELSQKLLESELNARSLKKQLDESALQATQAIMDRTKVLNEKLQLEKERDELNERLLEMEKSLQSLQKETKGKGQQLNCSDEISQSGYTSEEVVPLTRKSVTLGSIVKKGNGIQRQHNSSPDLGIESDAGRVSSVELTNVHRPLLMKIEVPTANGNGGDSQHIAIKTNNLDVENRPPNSSTNGGPIIHDCAKVEQENAELKRKLIRTKRQFEETYQKLKLQNQVKAQIEKDIKTQIIKTHHVLKNVRSNMEADK